MIWRRWDAFCCVVFCGFDFSSCPGSRGHSVVLEAKVTPVRKQGYWRRVHEEGSCLISSLAAVSRSSGVMVIMGDLNAKGQKHWIFLTSISDLTSTQLLSFSMICFPFSFFRSVLIFCLLPLFKLESRSNQIQYIMPWRPVLRLTPFVQKQVEFDIPFPVCFFKSL